MRRYFRIFRGGAARLLIGLLSLSSLSSNATTEAREGERTREPLRLAIVDLMATFPDQYPRGSEFLERFNICARDPYSTEIFERLQRDALLANPLVSGHPVLFVARRQYKPDHHNTETMFQTGEINTASFEGGAALKTLDLKTGQVQTLLETPHGSLRDPEVHFDGDAIVFSMRQNIDDDYHIYEINTDGSGLKQRTSAQGVTDIDPLYLPDNSIVFSSTREPKYCMCNRHIMANLFRMDRDGANIHQIGKSTLFEGHGALMPDGRILYSRWEYVDRNFGDAQGLWTVHPDGTSPAVYYGNNTQSPGAVLNARVIPETSQVICVFGSCHDRPWGALAIIDRRLGLDLRPPVVRTWPEDAIGLVGEGDWDRFNFDTFTRVNPKYEDPFPLSDKYFLCSRMTGKGETMGIFLIDVFGNEILVYAEDPGCYDPMPLAPSKRPPVIPARRDFENQDGYFYVADVYQGTHMQGVKHGAVKSLRVVESPEKRFWTHPPWEGQGQEAPAMNWHDFNNKRILGTVPVEPDGSAYFAAPPERFVYFQLLDENGMMIQSMRSGASVQSGEKQGCVGCHEERRVAPPATAGRTPMALRRPPSTLADWHGPARFFSYAKEVQPVFDKHCVRCHDYGTDAGAKLNLAGDRDLVFNTSYNELWRKKYIRAIGAGPAQIQQPYAWGSHASKLGENFLSKLHKGEVDPEEFDRIVTWIDLNAPYYPVYSSAFPDNLAGRCPLNNGQIKRLAELTGIPFAQQMNCAKDQGPRVSFERPEHSPCLAKFPDKNAPEYHEALAIIRAGQQTLAQRPREDMDGSQACAVDQRHEDKYRTRQQEEARNREAIRHGKKQYDPNRN